jgi:hypothetical protein
MAGDPTNPQIGDFSFDFTEIKPYSKDLAPGACQGMLTEREGFLGVYNEILTNQASHGAKAGIPDADAAELTLCTERIARIDAFLPAILKAVEILTETRYFLDDRRQHIVFDAATAIDRRARSNPDLFAVYEKTRAYRSAAAKKALKTEERNAAEEQAPDGEHDVRAEPIAPATA